MGVPHGVAGRSISVSIVPSSLLKALSKFLFSSFCPRNNKEEVNSGPVPKRPPTGPGSLIPFSIIFCLIPLPWGRIQT